MKRVCAICNTERPKNSLVPAYRYIRYTANGPDYESLEQFGLFVCSNHKVCAANRKRQRDMLSQLAKSFGLPPDSFVDENGNL